MAMINIDVILNKIANRSYISVAMMLTALATMAKVLFRVVAGIVAISAIASIIDN
jgi:hypothetical protein